MRSNNSLLPAAYLVFCRRWATSVILCLCREERGRSNKRSILNSFTPPSLVVAYCYQQNTNMPTYLLRTRNQNCTIQMPTLRSCEDFGLFCNIQNPEGKMVILKKIRLDNSKIHSKHVDMFTRCCKSFWKFQEHLVIWLNVSACLFEILEF